MTHRFGNVVTAAKLLAQLRVRHLGMAMFWACSLLLFRTSLFAPSGVDTLLASTTALTFSLAFNIITVVALALMEYFNQGFVRRLPPWVFGFITVGGIAVFSAIGSNNQTLSLDMLILGCVLSGVGFGFFWISWIQVFSHLHPDITTIAIPLNYIVTVIIFLFIPDIVAASGVPTWVFMAPLPFLSCLFLQRCRKAPEYETEPNTIQNLTEAVFSLRDILAAGVIFAFLFGFMWESSVLALASVDEAHRLPSIVALTVAALFFVVSLFGRRRWDLDLLLSYGVPVIVITFALLPLMFSTNILIAHGAMDSGFSLLEIIACVLVVTTSYDRRVCGIIVGAVVRTTFLVFRLSGIVAAYFINTLAMQSSISPAFFSILAVVAIWIWLMLVRRDSDTEEDVQPRSYIDRYERDIAHIDDDKSTVTVGNAIRAWAAKLGSERKQNRIPADNILFNEMSRAGNAYVTGREIVELAATSPHCDTHTNTKTKSDTDSALAFAPLVASSDFSAISETLNAEDSSILSEIAPVLERYCDAVGRKYGLSRRESEMLPYLALGRSASFIADTLYISENTVRTHIRHILEKTGATSKQAITDFVYEEGKILCN